jgi:RNA polymerase-binding transcription factor DksA
MNKGDRKKLNDLYSRLEALKSELDDLATAEQDKFDNMPDGLQQTESGQKIETAATAMRESCDSVESALDSIDNVKDEE